MSDLFGSWVSVDPPHPRKQKSKTLHYINYLDLIIVSIYWNYIQYLMNIQSAYQLENNFHYAYSAK